MGLRPQSAVLAAVFCGICLRAVSVQEIHIVGDATIRGDAIRLTAPKQDQAGAAWLREKQYIAAGFDTTFQFQLTEQGGFGPWKGADGFAFVMQNSGIDALGGYGSKGGFGAQLQGKGRAVIARSIAVFFDTYRNRTEGDPSSNYVVFRNYGREEGARWPAPRIAFVKRLPIN